MQSRTLLLGPAGSGKTHHALTIFKEYCRQREFHRTLFLLPTAGQVEHVKDLLLNSGELVGLLDSTVTNFELLARHRFRPGQWRRRLTPGLKNLLLQDMLKDPSLGRFVELSDKPGFLDYVNQLIREVKESGLDGLGFRQLVSRLFAGQGERREAQYQAARLLELFQNRIAALGLFDEEDMLEGLARTLGPGPGPFADLELVIIDGFYDFTPLEWRIIKGMASFVPRMLVTLPWDKKGERSGLFGAAGRSREIFTGLGFKPRFLRNSARLGSETLGQLESSIFSPEKRSIPWDGSLSLLEAADRLDEGEQIARQIKILVRDAGYRYRDIGIVCRSSARYRAILEKALGRNQIPFRLYGPRLLSRSRVVNEIRALVSLVLGPLTWVRLLPVLKSRRLCFPREAVDWLEIRALKQRPEVDWGGLIGLAQGECAKLKELFVYLLEAHQRARLPARPEFWRQWYQGLISRFLDLDFGPLPGEEEEEFRLREEGAALASFFLALAEVLQYCSLTGVEEMVGADFNRLMEVAVSPCQYWVRDLRVDVVNIVDAFEARQWELPVVFLCGLTQGEFPPLFKEDIFFTDQERHQLSRAAKAFFKQTQERHGEERYLFYSAITRAKEKLVLSYPGTDSNGERNLPSPYLEQVRGLFSSDNQVAMTESRLLSRLLPGPEEALDREELVQALGSGLACLEGSAGGSLLGWLFQRCLSAGWLEDEPDRWQRGLKWDLSAPARAEMVRLNLFSVSQLLEFSQCPYRHFAGHILRLEEISELGELGLEQRLAGTIVHQVLRRYYQSGEKRDISYLLEEVFSEACRGLPISLTEIAAKEQMRVSLSGFVDAQAERERDSCFRPFAFERAFGLGDVAPLVVPGVADGDILMRGKIDRLDVAEVDGRKLGLVIDYKYSTGRGKSLKLQQMEDDSLLQLTVYMLALERLYGLEPAGAFLYTLVDLGLNGLIHQGRWDLSPSAGTPPKGTISLPAEEFCQILAQGEERIAWLVRGIRSAYIRVKPRELRRCGPRGCRFSAVCRYEKWWERE